MWNISAQRHPDLTLLTALRPISRSSPSPTPPIAFVYKQTAALTPLQVPHRPVKSRRTDPHHPKLAAARAPLFSGHNQDPGAADVGYVR